MLVGGGKGRERPLVGVLWLGGLDIATGTLVMMYEPLVAGIPETGG